MTLREAAQAVVDWCLHPDRAYTPHEIAMHVADALRDALAQPEASEDGVARLAALLHDAMLDLAVYDNHERDEVCVALASSTAQLDWRDRFGRPDVPRGTNTRP